MSEQDFTIGAAYWRENGQKVEYVGTLTDGRHLVADVLNWDDYEGEIEIAGTPYACRKLFSNAPTKVFDERIDALKAEIKGLQDAKQKASQAKIDAQKSLDASLDTLKAHEALRHVEAFVRGEITHLVVRDYRGYKIGPVEAFQQMTDDWKPRPEGISYSRCSENHPKAFSGI